MTRSPHAINLVEVMSRPVTECCRSVLYFTSCNAFPDAFLQTYIPGAGHACYVDDSETFNAKLVECVHHAIAGKAEEDAKAQRKPG